MASSTLTLSQPLWEKRAGGEAPRAALALKLPYLHCRLIGALSPMSPARAKLAGIGVASHNFQTLCVSEPRVGLWEGENRAGVAAACRQRRPGRGEWAFSASAGLSSPTGRGVVAAAEASPAVLLFVEAEQSFYEHFPSSSKFLQDVGLPSQEGAHERPWLRRASARSFFFFFFFFFHFFTPPNDAALSL